MRLRLPLRLRLSLVAALPLLLTACGGYIGSGAPPAVTLDHPLRLEIAISGPSQPTVEQALKWVLAGTHQLAWVSSGGDAKLTLKGTMTEDREMLGGTECTFALALTAARDSGEPLTATKLFKSEPVTSNLQIEKERLITRGVVWALQETAARLAAPPPPLEAPPVAAPSEMPAPQEAAPAAPTPEPTPDPAPSHHRRRHHHRSN